jgi:hypothetical protein
MQVLIRDDIGQLRRADSIVFRFDTSEHGYSRIEGAIGRYEQREFTLPVNPTSVEAYGEPVVAGCWIISSARFVPEWQTALAMLRSGDQLHPHYVADAHHPVDRPERDPYFTDLLCIDTFDLRVRRPSASRTRPGQDRMFSFNLGYQITERDGGSARIRNLTTAERVR